jgi:hypothetical protein
MGVDSIYIFCVLFGGLWPCFVCHNDYIDQATPTSSIIRHRDMKILSLVMSDEFEQEGRRFEKGFDEFFESIMKPDDTNNAIQFCTLFSSNSHRPYLFLR